MIEIVRSNRSWSVSSHTSSHVFSWCNFRRYKHNGYLTGETNSEARKSVWANTFNFQRHLTSWVLSAL